MSSFLGLQALVDWLVLVRLLELLSWVHRCGEESLGDRKEVITALKECREFIDLETLVTKESVKSAWGSDDIQHKNARALGKPVILSPIGTLPVRDC